MFSMCMSVYKFWVVILGVFLDFVLYWENGKVLMVEERFFMVLGGFVGDYCYRCLLVYKGEMFNNIRIWKRFGVGLSIVKLLLGFRFDVCFRFVG